MERDAVVVVCVQRLAFRRGGMQAAHARAREVVQNMEEVIIASLPGEENSEPKRAGNTHTPINIKDEDHNMRSLDRRQGRPQKKKGESTNKNDRSDDVQ